MQIEIECQPDLPLIELDPGRVKQVVNNLLSNAIKHSPAGGTVQVRLNQDEDEMVRRRLFCGSVATLIASGGGWSGGSATQLQAWP